MRMTEFDTRAATAALHLEYETRDRLGLRPASWWRNALGVVGFGCPPADGGRLPTATTMTPLLDGDAELCEVWRVVDAGSSRPLSSAHLGRVHYRCNEDLLFGTVKIEEGGTEVLLRAAEAAYEEIFAVLQATQHRHLIRIWNYVPEINIAAGGEERYRLFNSARQSAFLKSGRATMGNSVPAACALGSLAGAPICIYFLAARRASKTIENPRQTSAYHYPPKFGKHSPIFSRACIFGDTQDATLFISGTSSIIGHETVHQGDAQAQTRETLVNINALLDEANLMSSFRRYSMKTLKLKVYVRRAADLSAVQAVLSREQLLHKPLYLKADICREELLMEIEAVGEARAPDDKEREG